MARLLAALLLLLAAPAALAGERTVILRTFEDGRYAADLPLCKARYGGSLNIVLGASAWSLQTNAARGEVVNEGVRLLGPVTGCGSAPSLAEMPPKPYTPKQFFLMKFGLADGTYVFEGECDLVSVTVPRAGILLVGCALRLVEKPEHVLGGFATSASIFNPSGVSGFGTGSVWTLHLYTKDDGPGSR